MYHVKLYTKFVCFFKKIKWVFFHQHGEELFFVKGALERVLHQCRYYAYRGTTLPMNQGQEEAYMQQGRRMGSSGLRGTTNLMKRFTIDLCTALQIVFPLALAKII